jgi:flagellin
MRELAVQSASDGMNADDRASIELEYSQLKAEITRIGDGTEYNNMKLIDGSRAKGLTSNGTFASSNAAVIDAAGTITADALFNNDELTFAYDSAATPKLTVTGSAGGTYTVDQETDQNGGRLVTVTKDSKTLTFNLETGKTDTDLDGIELSVGSTAMSNGVAGSKVSSYTANGTYTFTDGGGNTIKLTGPDSVEHEVTKAGGFSAGDEIQFDEAGIVIKLDSGYSAGELEGHELIVNDGAFTTVQVGSNNDADQAHSVASVGASVTENRITFNIADTTSAGLGISTTDLDSLGEAQSAINYLDAAIEKINDERGNIGSLQNRFEFASSNLMNSIQNNSASMSTIRDADFAVEAAGLARNQILTQSGTAMLAQANQISQNVLSLLQ